MNESVFVPENLDVILFGASGSIGSVFKEKLIEKKVPLFAPEQDLIDLHHAEYVKMLIGAVKPKLIINCASYSGEDSEMISHTNSVVPFNLSQICHDLDVPWMHVIRNHAAESEAHKACLEAEETIKNSDTKCYICKVALQPNDNDPDVAARFVDESLKLKDDNAEYGVYEF